MRGRCKRGLSVAAGEMFGRKKGRCEETHEYVPFLFTVSLSLAAFCGVSGRPEPRPDGPGLPYAR